MLLRSIAGLLVGLATIADAIAATPPAPESSYLDFGVPCENPHEEIDGPVLLRGNKTPPKSNPATPLTQPPYPLLSRQLGEAGTTVMRLLISESGAVSQAHVLRSSGSPRLDAAALEETRKWKLQAGKIDGKPRCMWGKFAATFKLEDYTREELAAVTVSPEARQFAQLVMGMDEMRSAMLASENILNETERKILNLALDAAAQEQPWIDAHEKVARIVAIEFTDAELAELVEFFSRPTASKWRRVGLKMNATLEAEQQVLAETLFCALGGITYEMRQPGAVTDPVALQIDDGKASAIEKYVGKVIPYCQCRRKFQPVPGATVSVLDVCGLPPKLDAP